MVINPLYRAQPNIPGIAVPAQNDEIGRISNLGKLLILSTVCCLGSISVPEYAAKIAFGALILVVFQVTLGSFFDR
jgi:hypothetical protein